MTSLIVGASGATGKHLVEQLVIQGQDVKVIVRTPENLPDSWKQNDQIKIIRESVLNLTVAEMAKHLQNCEAVASCLGHNMNLKGMFGSPRKLVTDAVMLLCDAIEINKPNSPVKFVLMNTAGNQNRDKKETISFGQKIILSMVRFLLPPHADNEKASDYLRLNIGQNNPLIKWAVVRPDGLIIEDEVSTYEVHVSPTRSAIFDPGTTSRINVGHFMASLITNDKIWNTWKGEMPVIYNKIT